MEWKWFCIFLSVLCIAWACTSMFSKTSDPLAQQIGAIQDVFLPKDTKEELIRELIAKYNPTNTVSTIQTETK